MIKQTPAGEQSFWGMLLFTLLTVGLVATFTKLGLWQYHKAQHKKQLQQQILVRSRLPAMEISQLQPRNLAELRYRSLKAAGHYDAHYQIFLDNQIYQGIAGYRVITPLFIASGQKALLVDRGWRAAPANHRLLPDAPIPQGTQAVRGTVWIPGHYFELAAPAPGWQPVWQNLNLERYASSVPFQIYPFVLRLEQPGQATPEEEFVQSKNGIAKNLSYAYQWFGFAVTSIAIYLFYIVRILTQRYKS